MEENNNLLNFKLNISANGLYLEDYINVSINDSIDRSKYDCDLQTFFNLFMQGGIFNEIIIDDFKYLLTYKDFVTILAKILFLMQPNALFKISNSQKDLVIPILQKLGIKNIECLEEFPKTSQKSEFVADTRIPCFVTIFFDFNTIKKVLDFLTKYNNRLKIIVIENMSDYTNDEIKPYVLNLLKEKKIEKYYLYEKNIGVNVLKTTLMDNIKTLISSPLMMLADGDMEVINNDKWLDEILGIMTENSEIFACGVDLDLSNLPPDDICPNASTWVPKAVPIEGKNYNEGYTGPWFLVQRRQFFVPMVIDIIKNNYAIIDSTMHNYCNLVYHMKWARTPISRAYHYSWDGYTDKNNKYVKWKSQFSFDELWKHEKFCNYQLFENR